MNKPRQFLLSQFNDRPLSRALILGAWLLSVMVCGWIAVNKLKLITNVAQFMPQANTAAEKLLVDQLHEGTAAKIILMAIEGGELTAITDASKRLAKQLSGNEAFARVDNGEQSLQSLQDTPLFRYRYLLSPDITSTEHFAAPTLKAVFQQRLLDLTSPLSLLSKQLLPEDPTNETGTLVKLLLAQDKTHRQFGVWVSPDNKRALLLVQTRAPGYDLDAQAAAIDAIHTAFDRINSDIRNKTASATPLHLLLSGPPVFATNSRNQIQHEVTALSLLASLMVLLILWLAYRSVALLFLSAIPLLSALLVASAALTVIFGPIHGITLAFGVTILGVAIDYPIHLFSHLSGKRSVREELAAIWPTLRLGVITTAAGYIAMTATDFAGLAQLGSFAMIGLLAAAAVTRWVLPALLPHTYTPITWSPSSQNGKQNAGARFSRAWFSCRWFSRLPQPGRTAWIASLLMGAGALAYIATHSQSLWESDLAALSPIPKSQLALDRQLRDDIGAPDASHLLLLTAPNAEQALQQSEALFAWLNELTANGAISGFDAAARYLPSVKTQRQRQTLLPDEPKLQAAVDQALQGLPFKAAQFQPFIQAVAAAKTAAPVTLETLQGSALGIKVGSLLFPKDSGWAAVIPLLGVNHGEQIAAGVNRLANPNVYYLDFKAVTNQLIHGFRTETLQRIQWASLLIIVVLAIGVRSARGLLAALLPVSLAIIVTMAILLVAGQSLSLFNLVALLLVFGIGIDYGLFFSREENDAPMRRRTFHALSICAISTVSVFGILSFSAVPVLQDIGITVWLGVLLSFVFSYLLAQPAASLVKQDPQTKTG